LCYLIDEYGHETGTSLKQALQKQGLLGEKDVYKKDFTLKAALSEIALGSLGFNCSCQNSQELAYCIGVAQKALQEVDEPLCKHEFIDLRGMSHEDFEKAVNDELRRQINQSLNNIKIKKEEE